MLRRPNSSASAARRRRAARKSSYTGEARGAVEARRRCVPPLGMIAKPGSPSAPESRCWHPRCGSRTASASRRSSLCPITAIVSIRKHATSLKASGEPQPVLGRRNLWSALKRAPPSVLRPAPKTRGMALRKDHRTARRTGGERVRDAAAAIDVRTDEGEVLRVQPREPRVWAGAAAARGRGRGGDRTR